MAMTHPALWNSAHRPIYYVYPYPAYSYSNVFTASGYAAFDVGAPVVALSRIGQKVYIASGIYAGDWVILGFVGTTVVTNATYTATDSDLIYMAETVNGEIWAGYASTHEGYSTYPYRKLADIQHPEQIGGSAIIDVSGFVSAAMGEVATPHLGADFAMSIPFKLIVSGESQYIRYAVRGSLPHTYLAAFNADYAILAGADPIHFENGAVVYSMIWPDTSVHGEHIFNILGVDGAAGVQSLDNGVQFDSLLGTFIAG